MNLEKCRICRHHKNLHGITLGGEKFCAACLIDAAKNEHISRAFFNHNFKLDNLQLVEDLAKEKGLV